MTEVSEIRIVCDGGCSNNQNPEKREAYGSYAVRVFPPEKDIVSETLPKDLWEVHRVFFGPMTNNQAEYLALINGVMYVKDHLERVGGDEGMFYAVRGDFHLHIGQVTVITDSKLMMSQLTGSAKVKNAGLIPLYHKAKACAQEIKDMGIKTTIRHVGREEIVPVLGH
jgi:ribonuclease HI